MYNECSKAVQSTLFEVGEGKEKEENMRDERDSKYRNAPNSCFLAIRPST